MSVQGGFKVKSPQTDLAAVFSVLHGAPAASRVQHNPCLPSQHIPAPHHRRDALCLPAVLKASAAALWRDLIYSGLALRTSCALAGVLSSTPASAVPLPRVWLLMNHRGEGKKKKKSGDFFLIEKGLQKNKSTLICEVLRGDLEREM